MDVIVKVRDPDENLEEKIKAYKVKKRIKTAVTILAFVFALISSYLLVKLQTYTSFIFFVQNYHFIPAKL